MVRILSWATMIVFALGANLLWAQGQSEAWPRANPGGSSQRAVGPDQPVNPGLPKFQRRAAPGATGAASQNQFQPPQPAPPPFTLTPQEDAQLDRVLKAWEQRSKDIKTFDCSFKRWEYDPTLPGADPKVPTHVDLGIIKYAAPDKGLFRVLKTETAEGKLEPVEAAWTEHWICDGKSVYQYVPRETKLVEHKLPPELQGKAIVNGPLPFLFGAEAQKLRQRYWLRLIAPPPERKKEIWLEAYPRFQEDAANYSRATLGLSASDMTPTALEIIQPNEKSHTSYVFYDIVINDPLRLIHGNPFQAYTPRGWTKVVDDETSQQAGRRGGGVR